MTSEVDRRTEPREGRPGARRANTWMSQRARPVSGTVTGQVAGAEGAGGKTQVLAPECEGA